MLSEFILTSALRSITNRYLTLENDGNVALPAPQTGHSYMLYMHIPFCESLCPYCSFNRVLYKEKMAREYFQQLRKEMRLVADLGYRFDSMYIGGGTPTVRLEDLAVTIDLARELFGVKEVSCETNPNHLTLETARILEGRVQRMSVGVQSFNDDLLRKMNRYYRFGSGEMIQKQIASVAGLFPSLNVDMIFNFPGQSETMLREDIARVIDSGANQVTFYPLMSSPSVSESMRKTMGEVTTENEAAYYHLVVDEMSRVFDLSTAWTFNRRHGTAPAAQAGNDMIDEYIVDYQEYVGVGSGAFSYLDGGLFINTFSLQEYRDQIEANRMPLTACHRYGKYQMMRYRMLMELFGLRLDKKRFLQDFGLPVEVGLPVEMGFLAVNGAFAHNDSSALTLTPRGRYLLVVMMREFFVGMNNVRDQARKSLPANEWLTMCASSQQPAD